MDGDQGSNQPSKPPPKKGVFKGKRAKPKFSRNARKGSDLKGGISRQRYRDAVAAAEARGDPPVPASPTFTVVASATSRAAISSPTKQEFKAAVRRHVKQLRRLTAMNESQLKKNSSLKRKLEDKEATIKVAIRQNSLHKAALKKAEKAKARVETALHREMAFRTEDAQIAQAAASAAEAAFDKERRDFQAAFKLQQQEFDLLLKEAVSEAKVCVYLI
eukprot:scaffold144557_cov36-Cyclotella_meneghiniana.AAC.1